MNLRQILGLSLILAAVFCILLDKDDIYKDDTFVDVFNNNMDTSAARIRNPKCFGANKSKADLKYILVSPYEYSPFHLLQNGQRSFIDNKCKYTNCFLTSNVHYFKDHHKFDAIVYSIFSLIGSREIMSFKTRPMKQIYIFASLEPSPLLPITNPKYDNFFNWTWTFKLNSDILWRYISIYDLNGTQVGPDMNMKWPKDMKPTSELTKIKLRQKSKPVAWFVSHCTTVGGRENFVRQFQPEFKKYGWSIDIYGTCGQYSCYGMWCHEMLKKHYFFYFSFENSLQEDYVTEKLLTALNNLVVPVVYGGADYSRFLPPGSYLNARELGPRNLAKAMNDALRNMSVYYDFFRWRNHFKYKASEANTDLCNICAAFNDKDKIEKKSTYNQFRLWWNGAARQKIYDVMLKVFLSSKALLSLAVNYNYTRHASQTVLQIINNQSSVLSIPKIKAVATR